MSWRARRPLGSPITAGTGCYTTDYEENPVGVRRTSRGFVRVSLELSLTLPTSTKYRMLRTLNSAVHPSVVSTTAALRSCEPGFTYGAVTAKSTARGRLCGNRFDG